MILNDLNAFGALEWLVENPPAGWLVYGPKSMQEKGWTGVVVWMRPTGYYTYHTLTLFGVWLVGDVVRVGVRHLTFSASHYNPESYFHHIRRDFRVHYGESPAPPDAPLYERTYTPTDRLTMRREIQQLTETFFPENPS